MSLVEFAWQRVAPAVAVVAASAALFAAPASAAKRTVPYGFYGAMYAGDVERAPADVQTRAWDKLASAGVESTRIVFSWAAIQPERGGPHNWKETDVKVAGAAAHNVDVLATVLGTPGWARKYPSVNQSPPARPADYGAFLTELIERYGPKGSFWAENPGLPRRALRHLQIWNEPTLREYWWREGDWSSADAKQFGALVRGSYRAIHRADPGAKGVLGGLTNFAWETLATLYRQAGIKGYFDVAAVHMFPGNWRNVAVITRRFRQTLDRYGARRVPIWVTEVSWPAAEGRSDVPDWANTPYYREFVTTEKVSARRLSRAYGLLAGRSFRAETLLQRVYWFTGVSNYTAQYDIWDYSGLMQLDGSNVLPKPAHDAFRASARRHQGCAKKSNGRC